MTKVTRFITGVFCWWLEPELLKKALFPQALVYLLPKIRDRSRRSEGVYDLQFPSEF